MEGFDSRFEVRLVEWTVHIDRRDFADGSDALQAGVQGVASSISLEQHAITGITMISAVEKEWNSLKTVRKVYRRKLTSLSHPWLRSDLCFISIWRLCVSRVISQIDL